MYGSRLLEELNSNYLKLYRIFEKISQGKEEYTSSKDKQMDIITLINKILKCIEKKEAKLLKFQEQRDTFLQEFETEVKTLQEKWSEYHQKKKKLSQEKEQFFQDVEIEMNIIKKEKLDLKQQHLQVEQIIKKANADYELIITNTKIAKEGLDLEIQMLKEQKEQSIQHISIVQRDLQQFLDRIQELQDAQIILEEEDLAIKKQIQDQYELREKINTENQELINQIQSYNEKQIQMNRQHDQLKQSIEVHKQTLAQITNYMAEEKIKMTNLEKDYELFNTQVKKCEEKCKQLSSQISEKQLQLQKIENMIAKGFENEQKLQKSKQEQAFIKNEITRCHSDYQELNQKNDEARLNLQDSKRNFDQITKLLIEKQTELANTERQLATITKSLEIKTQDLENLQENIENTKKDSRKLELEKSKLQEQHDLLQINTQAIKQEHTIQQQTVKALQKQIDKKVQELSSLTQQCQAAKEDSESHIQRSESQLFSIQSQCEQKQYEYSQIVNQIEEIVEQKELLQQDIERLKQINYEQQCQDQSIEQKSKEIKTKKDHYQKQLSKLQKSEKELSNRLQIQIDQSSYLNQVISEQEQQLMLLKREYEQTQSRLRVIREAEDLYYVSSALEGKGIDDFGQERIQKLVQSQNQLEQYEKAISQLQQCVTELSEEKEQLLSVLNSNNILFIKKQKMNQSSPDQFDNFRQSKRLTISDQRYSGNKTVKTADFFGGSPINIKKKTEPTNSNTKSKGGVAELLKNLEELNQNLDQMHQESVLFQPQDDS